MASTNERWKKQPNYRGAGQALNLASALTFAMEDLMTLFERTLAAIVRKPAATPRGKAATVHPRIVRIDQRQLGSLTEGPK